MLIEELTKQAALDSKKKQRLLAWKFQNNNLSLLGYLYWRNRFAILGRLISRGILILEIYLINHYFNFLIATAFGLVLLTFYYLKEFQRGLAQSAKKEILEAKIIGKSKEARLALGDLVALSLIYGILCPLLFLLTAQYLAFDFTLQILIASWVILFPLQLLSGGYWSILYGFHRLRRSFYLLLTCRILPIVCLITFGTYWGVSAYLVGLLLGRGTEFSYLLIIASKALRRQEIWPQFKRLHLLATFTNNLPQLILPICFAAYNVTFALMIFIRERSEWLSYFFLIYSIQLIIYFILRGPQSLAMDFFQSLINLDLEQARVWLKKSYLVRNFLLAMIFASTILIGLVLPDLILQFPELTKILPFLLLLLLARSIFLTKFLFIQSAFLEKLYIGKFVLFFFLLIALQAILIFNLRANLNLIYLTEGLSLLAFSMLLPLKKNLAASAVYQFKKTHKQSDFSLAHLLNSNYANLKAEDIILLQLDTEFCRIDKRNLILTEIANSLVLKHQIVPVHLGLYLIISLEAFDFQKTRANLLQSFPAVIRNIFAFNNEQPLDVQLQAIASGIGKTNSQSKKISSLRFQLEDLAKNPALVKITQDIATSNSNQSESLLKIFAGQGFPDLNYLSTENLAKIKTKNIDHLLYLQGQRSKSAVSGYLLPSSKKPYLDILDGGKVVFSIDYTGASSAVVQKLRNVVMAINVGFILRLATKH